jgi:endonuclease YncB( thermonuclease family)
VNRGAIRFSTIASFFVVAWVLSAPTTARADDWLVYLGGELEAIEGGWSHRRGQVVFRTASGTLASTPFSEVDLAASAFITWQLNGRTEAPPRGPLPQPDEDEPAPGRMPCSKAVVVGLLGSETLEVSAGGERETVHVACLDAPETGYELEPLEYFGETTMKAIRRRITEGVEVCLSEHSPPMRDAEGHRIVFVTLDRGDDYSAGLIAAGLGLLRIGACSRAAELRSLEDRAIAEGRGLWGRGSETAAFSVAQSSMVFTPVGDAAGGGKRRGGRTGGEKARPRQRPGGG